MSNGDAPPGLTYQETTELNPSRAEGSQKPYDIATLIVDDINYESWESVWVQLRWHDGWSKFKFTAVEKDTAGIFYPIQFMPGAKCMVLLGGVPVIKGIIETRQVAYDEMRHGVELIGASATALVSRASVDTGSGSFDGMTFEQVAKDVLKNKPVKYKVLGKLNERKYERLQNQPGELIFDFLERIARPRGIIIGSDSFGNFVFIGDHSKPIINTQLIEGQNIRRCQFFIHEYGKADDYKVIAQANASDENAFLKSSQIEAEVKGSGLPGTKLITPAEQPVKDKQEALERAKHEALWHEGPAVRFIATVQGWFRDEMNLWWPGDNVYCYSPMCPVNMLMKIEVVTFQQDSNGGTETILECVQPWALKDQAEMNTGPGNAPMPFDPTKPLPVPPIVEILGGSQSGT